MADDRRFYDRFGSRHRGAGYYSRPDYDTGNAQGREATGRYPDARNWPDYEDYAPGGQQAWQNYGDPGHYSNGPRLSDEGTAFGSGGGYVPSQNEGLGQWASSGGGRREGYIEDDGANRGPDFRGRGPKGYTRSDDRIREDVCERLSADRYVDASEIEVEVEDGEVRLVGEVDTRFAKRAAEDCAHHVSGVHDVQNAIRVRRSDASRMTRSFGDEAG